jgi:hypothetical protein
MRFPKRTPIKIVMIGAGGTGAHTAPNIYRLIYALDRPVRFIIADGDSVEEKNLVRQHFCPAELGMNKAKAIVERYALAFGMAPEYIPDFIEDKDKLLGLLKPENVHLVPGPRAAVNEACPVYADELVILIGAVDNNKSRRMCHETFGASKNLIYIDSGNGEYSGQVVCGVRKNGRTLSKPIGALYPDILSETDKFPTELSCAEASVSAPQAITANITAAAVVTNIVYNILILGENNAASVTFSTKSINVRSEKAARKKVKKVA